MLVFAQAIDLLPVSAGVVACESYFIWYGARRGFASRFRWTQGRMKISCRRQGW